MGIISHINESNGHEFNIELIRERENAAWTDRKESERLLPAGRVLATQFHPRKVAAIDTAPKGRMKRDRSATTVPKARIGACACRAIESDLEKSN